MTVLLMRLAGPMQSWGTQSRFTNRDTGLEPSRSGVVGLLCAALGRSRDQSLDIFRPLRMAVRVDREGRLMRDYQTAQRFSGGRTISAPAWQENARWNSGRFERVPITRYFGTGCGSVASAWRCASRRMASPRS